MSNVLVFESDPAFAGELKGELEQRGCTVTVVDDASVGLQTAATEKPDLILLTIELPRMNGFSVCNKLKRDPALKEVPLIILSSDSTEETFEQHRRLRTHAEDYVHKPIAFADLLPRITAYVPINGGASAPAAPSDDIVIDDDIDFEDETASPVAAAAEEPAPPSGVDDEVDAFTENAFGSMVDEAPAPVAVRGRACARRGTLRGSTGVDDGSRRARSRGGAAPRIRAAGSAGPRTTGATGDGNGSERPTPGVHSAASARGRRRRPSPQGRGREASRQDP